MRVLITGGAGFIGSHLAESYLADGHQVKVLDMADLDGSENVRVIMRFVADAKYGFAGDIVTYGITNSAN